MRRFLMTIALGFGLALGGGLVYSLITSETARLFGIGFGMFILGAVIVGFFVIVANYLLVRAFTGRQERTTINYPSPTTSPRVGVLPPWSSPSPPALPSPPSAWPAFGPHQMGFSVPSVTEQQSEAGEDDDYVA